MFILTLIFLNKINKDHREIDMITSNWNLENFVFAGPILEVRTCVRLFRKRAKKKDKKGQNIRKFGQKCTKLLNTLKKGRSLNATIPRSKLLEKALLCICHIHSKEATENATRKQSFIENINLPCRVCLQISQSYVYALKLSSEVKMFSH